MAAGEWGEGTGQPLTSLLLFAHHPLFVVTVSMCPGSPRLGGAKGPIPPGAVRREVSSEVETW